MQRVTHQSSFNLLLTLKEVCENFYRKLQDSIMIITNFIHLFVSVLWASFSLLFSMLFFNRRHVQQVVDDGARIQIRKLFLQDPNKKKL